MNEKIFNFNIFKTYAEAIKKHRLSKLSNYSFDLYDSLYKSFLSPLKNISDVDEALLAMDKVFQTNNAYKSFYKATLDEINLLLYNDFKKIIKKYHQLYRDKTLPDLIKYKIKD